jgi:hypothetical protein
LSAISPIPDHCASPIVILSGAPESVGPKFAWPVAHQTLLANQQFKVVKEAPKAPGEVLLATYKHKLTQGYALVAKCKDGGTCNRLAAMYKAVVRSSRPELACGKIDTLGARPVRAPFAWADDVKGNLPKPGDLQGACARLNACMIATDRATEGDPFLACQKAPSHFKTDCARRYPCAEVLACTGK